MVIEGRLCTVGAMTDESLVPPPPAARPGAVDVSRFPEGWRSVALVTWLLVFGSMTAIAVSSRTIGRSIWWLGPSVDPAPIVAVAVPMGICLVPLWALVRRPASSGRIGIACSILLAITALPDLDNSPGVAAAVLAVSFAALLSTGAVAIATRHYR